MRILSWLHDDGLEGCRPPAAGGGGGDVFLLIFGEEGRGAVHLTAARARHELSFGNQPRSDIERVRVL